jgi:hypothetical protein
LSPVCLTHSAIFQKIPSLNSVCILNLKIFQEQHSKLNKNGNSTISFDKYGGVNQHMVIFALNWCRCTNLPRQLNYFIVLIHCPLLGADKVSIRSQEPSAVFLREPLKNIFEATKTMLVCPEGRILVTRWIRLGSHYA